MTLAVSRSGGRVFSASARASTLGMASPDTSRTLPHSTTQQVVGLRVVVGTSVGNGVGSVVGTSETVGSGVGAAAVVGADVGSGGSHAQPEQSQSELMSPQLASQSHCVGSVP